MRRIGYERKESGRVKKDGDRILGRSLVRRRGRRVWAAFPGKIKFEAERVWLFPVYRSERCESRECDRVGFCKRDKASDFSFHVDDRFELASANRLSISTMIIYRYYIVT